MGLIDEDLRHGLDRLADGLFHVGLADAFGMDVDVAEVEIIALGGELFREVLGADTERATRTTENDCKHETLLRFVTLVQPVLGGPRKWRRHCR